MKHKAREILGVLLILILGLLSLGAWQAFFIVMVMPGVSDLWRPMIWFFFLATFFFLGTAVWTKKSERMAAAVAMFLPGIFFLRSWEHAAVSILSAALVFRSGADITREFAERVRFHFFKSVRTGQLFFIIGLALSLSSGYYVFLKDASWEELVPRFRVGEEMTAGIFKAASVVNPSFAALSDEDVTVDEFLLQLERNKRENAAAVPEAEVSDPNRRSGSDVSSEMIRYPQERNGVLISDANLEKIEQELFLRSGREQIATLAGRPVQGDEKMSDMLSTALQRKLIAFLNGVKETDHVPSQAIPFFLSLLLFFTLLPFFSLFGIVCILLARLLFACSLRLGWLRLDKVTVEQERLAE